MATPLNVLRPAVVAALQGSSALSKVQVFRRYPDELLLPRIVLFRGRQEKERLHGEASSSTAFYSWTAELELEITADRNETTAPTIDAIENAVDTLFETHLTLTGFTVHRQFITEFEWFEGTHGGVDSDAETSDPDSDEWSLEVTRALLQVWVSTAPT